MVNLEGIWVAVLCQGKVLVMKRFDAILVRVFYALAVVSLGVFLYSWITYASINSKCYKVTAMVTEAGSKPVTVEGKHLQDMTVQYNIRGKKHKVNVRLELLSSYSELEKGETFEVFVSRKNDEKVVSVVSDERQNVVFSCVAAIVMVFTALFIGGRFDKLLK